MVLADRFLPYELARELTIHGREHIVEFGARDPIGGPLVWPIIVRLGVN